MGMYTVLAAAAVLMAQGSLALAENSIEWVGGAQGSWDDPVSWDLGRVPTYDDVVIFDIRNSDSDESVHVDVPTGSIFCSLNIVSGDVVFDMDKDAFFIAVRTSSGCFDSFETVKIGGAGQIASLTVNGGILTDGLDSGWAQIVVGYEMGSVGTLTLTGDIRSEIIEDGGLIMLANETDSRAYFVVESDIDLHSFEIATSRHIPSKNSVVLVADGVQLQVGEISDVGLLEVGAGALVESARVDCDRVYMKNNAELIGEYLLLDSEIVLESGAKVQANSLHADTIEVGEPTATFSVGGIGNDFKLDISHLTAESEPLIKLSDIVHHGQIGANILVSSGQYPDVGAVLPLAEYARFFGSNRPREAAEDPRQFSFVMYSLHRYDEVERSYSIANDFHGASLLVGIPYMHPADLNFDGRLDFFDVPVFVDLFIQGSPWANIDRVDGVNIRDILLFIEHIQD